MAGATFAYRWLRVASDVETQVAAGETYTVVAAGVGAKLKVEVTYTDDGDGTETVESATPALARSTPVPAVSVSCPASPAAEGEDARFTVTRTEVTTGALTVRYDVSETGDMVAWDKEGAQTVDFGDGGIEKTVMPPTEDARKSGRPRSSWSARTTPARRGPRPRR